MFINKSSNHPIWSWQRCHMCVCVKSASPEFRNVRVCVLVCMCVCMCVRVCKRDVRCVELISSVAVSRQHQASGEHAVVLFSVEIMAFLCFLTSTHTHTLRHNRACTERRQSRHLNKIWIKCFCWRSLQHPTPKPQPTKQNEKTA